MSDERRAEACMFCGQSHEPENLSWLGISIKTCPNLPENWGLVQGNGEPVVIEWDQP